MYSLYAVLVHAGHSVHSGHYYCFVKAANGLWFMMDDSSVRQVGLSHVLEQKAYMLCYQRTSLDAVEVTGANNTTMMMAAARPQRSPLLQPIHQPQKSMLL